MKRIILYLTIAFLSAFCFAKAQAQGNCVSNFGTTKDTCWSKTAGYLWLPVYADGDSVDNILAVDVNGKVYKRAVPTPTTPSLQQVTDVDSVTTRELTVAQITLTTPYDDGTPDAALIIERTLASPNTNAHGARDHTIFPTSGYSYNSYDAAITMTGAGHGHGAAFQSRYVVNMANATDTMNDLYSMTGINSILKGFVRRHYAGGDAYNYFGGTDSAVGIEYGWHVQRLYRGRKNFAFASEGTTPSSFGGNVGIGLDSAEVPTSALFTTAENKSTLHIKGDAPQIRLQYNNGGTPSDYYHTSDNINVLFYTTDSMRYRWYTDGGEKMRLTALGELGIKTQTPLYNLDVNGTARVVGLAVLDSVVVMNDVTGGTEDSALALNSSNEVIKVPISTGTPTLNAVLTSGNTSTLAINTGKVTATVTSDNVVTNAVQLNNAGAGSSTGTAIRHQFGQKIVGQFLPVGMTFYDKNETDNFYASSSELTFSKSLTIKTTLASGVLTLNAENGAAARVDIKSADGLRLNTFSGSFSERFKVLATGFTSISSTAITPVSQLDLSAANGYAQFRLRTSYTPTSTADANGNTGDVAWDADYIYIKTAAGWKRATLATW